MKSLFTLKNLLVSNLKKSFILLAFIITAKSHASNTYLITSLDTVPKPCAANFTYNTKPNHILTLDFSPVNVDSVSTDVYWSFGDGGTSTLQYPTHNFGRSGVYTVCLGVRSTIDTSCYDERCISVLVADPIDCKAQFSIRGDTTNDKLIYFINESKRNDVTYAWDFGDGGTSTQEYPQHLFATTGMHTVCLTIKSLSDSTCSNTFCDSMNVGHVVNCDSYFTLQRDSLDHRTYRVQNLATGVNPTYKWDFGDGYTSNSFNPGPHTYAHPGVYGIFLNIYCKGDASVNYMFGRRTIVSFDETCKSLFNITPDSSTTDPYDFIIYNQSLGTNLNYHWFFGDDDTSNVKNPTHEYLGTGPYTICLAIKNNTCYSEYCDTLSLDDTLHHLLPANFHIKVVDKTTDVNETIADKITLQNYPNPFSEGTAINYEISTQAAVELTVFNVLGSKIDVLEKATKQSGVHHLEWNPQNLPEGIYILQLRVNDQILTKRMIKK